MIRPRPRSRRRTRLFFEDEHEDDDEDGFARSYRATWDPCSLPTRLVRPRRRWYDLFEFERFQRNEEGAL